MSPLREPPAAPLPAADPPDAPLPRAPARAAILLGSLVFVLAVGWVDYATGLAIGLPLFYLLPVTICGWWLGWAEALFAGVFAGGVWLLADAFVRAQPPGASVWNALMRAGVFATVGILIARLRADRRQLQALNLRLERMLERESQQARTDPLTGLPNSRAFHEALERELARLRRHGGTLALAFLDLDNFKLVNDARGHAAGDALLAQMAAALRDGVRAGDLAARLGGDEFAVLFAELPADGLAPAAQRLLERVTEIARAQQEPSLGASVGAVLFARPPAEGRTALVAVDAAMYEAKRAGKNRVQLRVFE